MRQLTAVRQRAAATANIGSHIKSKQASKQETMFRLPRLPWLSPSLPSPLVQGYAGANWCKLLLVYAGKSNASACSSLRYRARRGILGLALATTCEIVDLACNADKRRKRQKNRTEKLQLQLAAIWQAIWRVHARSGRQRCALNTYQPLLQLFSAI